MDSSKIKSGSGLGPRIQRIYEVDASAEYQGLNTSICKASFRFQWLTSFPDHYHCKAFNWLTSFPDHYHCKAFNWLTSFPDHYHCQAFNWLTSFPDHYHCQAFSEYVPKSRAQTPPSSRRMRRGLVSQVQILGPAEYWSLVIVSVGLQICQCEKWIP